MSHWTRTSVRKAQGSRSHRNNLLVRNDTLIKQQKLNRMSNILKKLEILKERSTGANKIKHTTRA